MSEAAAVSEILTGPLNGQSGYRRARHDFYREPAWIVEKLVDWMDRNGSPITGQAWDPCCGTGNIPRVLRERGIDSIGSDLIDRGFGEAPLDFFGTWRSTDWIVSNPPYAPIEQFVRHALSNTSRGVAVLARLSFLESKAREALFDTTPLAHVLVSRARVSMPPGEIPTVEARGGTIPYAWFIWRKHHRGAPTVGWV